MKIILSILDGKKNISSPWHEHGKVNSIFVRFDKTSRIGYLLFWCSITYKGVIFSRLEIPENADYILANELEKSNLPDIKLENVKF